MAVGLWEYQVPIDNNGARLKLFSPFRIPLEKLREMLNDDQQAIGHSSWAIIQQASLPDGEVILDGGTLATLVKWAPELRTMTDRTIRDGHGSHEMERELLVVLQALAEKVENKDEVVRRNATREDYGPAQSMWLRKHNDKMRHIGRHRFGIEPNCDLCRRSLSHYDMTQDEFARYVHGGMYENMEQKHSSTLACHICEWHSTNIRMMHRMHIPAEDGSIEECLVCCTHCYEFQVNQVMPSEEDLRQWLADFNTNGGM